MSEQKSKQKENIGTIWPKLVAAFPSKSAFFFLLYAATGINPRNKQNRLERFLANKNVQSADRLLEGVSEKLLCDLYIRAGVNYEQAREAMKLNILLNVTFPVAIIYGFLEITDGNLIEIVNRLLNNEIVLLYLSVAIAFTIAAALIIYSYATTMAARDLRDYLKIKVSEQSDTPTFL